MRYTDRDIQLYYGVAKRHKLDIYSIMISNLFYIYLICGVLQHCILKLHLSLALVTGVTPCSVAKKKNGTRIFLDQDYLKTRHDWNI